LEEALTQNSVSRQRKIHSGEEGAGMASKSDPIDVE